MNYTQLKTAIQDYTQSSETSFVTNIDTFITQAENRLFFDIDVPDFHKNVTGTMTQNNTFLQKPEDLFKVYSLAVIKTGNVYSYMLPKDVSFIREAFPDADDSGLPTHYGNFDDEFFIVGPVPDDDYSVELHYKFQPDALSSTNANSWFGDNAEAALLYATLVEAYTYLKGEQDIMSFYGERYSSALQALQNYGAAEVNMDSYRNTMRRTA
jgi:hypothetical protein|tara:strand:+ start:4701 stop:5333 length:633 start_codon:yes stop_codon:yes gene_type:complete